MPTLLYRLLDMPEALEHDLSSLRTVHYGAAPMSPAKLKPLQERFGNIFVQVYGSTECLQPVSTLDKADHANASIERLASAGRIAPGIELLVVDETGAAMPAGSI
ncbi:AMP-binding protein, partial [Paraburkholderia sp. SIMBA_030]|uniref:AMP-binding protein n=1 Tax=Paraburkholderia sp. SIMBA_030 TaxID=3085773 RepID=UPI00397A1D33